MHPRIPTPIHTLLNDYIMQLDADLPGLVTGLYLHGSIALDAFDERQSDIDFLAFLSRRASTADGDALAAIHQIIATTHPRWLLEGSYIQWDEIGKLEEEVAPAPVHHDNKFDASGNFDVNSVTWWVLKHHGIALIGPPPQDLAFDVDWQLLITRMKQNLNTYWASFVRKPQRMAWLLSDFGVEWAVLGTLRQYYSFVAHDITSKRGAGAYALQHLPAKWHMIIREAIRIRDRMPGPLFSSKIKRAAEAYNFLRFIIEYCNSLPA